MKTLYKILASMLFVFTLYSNVSAQDSTKTTQNPQNVNNNNQTIKHGGGFVDLNGDGYNDNAPDHDGDGIPNGLDKDYIKFKRNGQGQGRRMRFIDLDGDGINDNARKGFGRGMNRQMKFNNSSTHPLNNNNAAGATKQTSGNANGNKNQKRGNK